VRAHGRIILAIVCGVHPQEIERGAASSVSQVYRVAHRALEAGPAGVADRREDNGESRVDEQYVAVLLTVVDGSPRQHGYRRPTWTRELLIVVLQKKTEIRISRSTMCGFMGWVCGTHTMRYHAHYHTSGLGHVYQQRYKSFPIQDGEHVFVVCRYVERNALRVGLVSRAENWRWGSLWRWLQSPEPKPKLLSPWLIPRLPNWMDRVSAPLTDAELVAVRQCVQLGRPLGDEGWVESILRRLGLESTMRPRGHQRVRPVPEKQIKES